MPDVEQIEYVDPALLRGSAPSRATDIWSLGAVLHFAASGGLSLYPDMPIGNPLASVRRVLGGAPTITDDLPEALTTTIGAAVSVNPILRPATAGDLADRIDQFRERS